MSTFLTPGWFVLLASVLLLVGLGLSISAIMRRRVSGRWRALIITLNAFAVVLLWILLTQPASRGEPSRTALLLTPGSSLSNSFNSTGRLVISVDGKERVGVSAVPDLTALARNFPQIDRLEVTGHGLPLRDWLQAGRWAVDFTPSSLPAGFVDMAWPHETLLGGEMTLSGRLNSPDSSAWKIRVVDPGGRTLEEQAPSSDGRFEFLLRPAMAGGVVFQLLAVDTKGDVRMRETVPVWVQRPNPPTTLMLLATPSFEARHLKNWLSHNSGGLTLETRLAREIRRVETMGENPPTTEIGTDTLKTIDLLVLDAGRLNDLGQASRQIISNAVTNGLGLLVLGDETISDEVRRETLLADMELQDSEADSIAGINLFGGTLESFSPGLSLAASPARILLSDDANVPLMAIRPHGAGQVGISLLTDSHSWRAVDQNQVYGRIWQLVVARIARPIQSELHVRRATDLLSVRDLLTVCEEEICRSEWLEQPGWTRYGEDGATLGVYAHDSDQWQAWRAQHSLKATQRVANMAAPTWAANSSLSSRFDQRLIWALFLLLVAFIWLEQKLGDGR
jgi:hypothetical protein